MHVAGAAPGAAARIDRRLARGPLVALSRSRRLHARRFARVGDVHGGMDEAVCDLRVLLEWVEREEKEGLGEAPYPPNFPKMPGEPARVQPSRARKPE